MVDAQARTSHHLDALADQIEQGHLNNVRTLFSAMHPAEIASLLESLPQANRLVAWNLLDPHDEGEVLLHVNDEVRSHLIHRTDSDELVAAMEGLAVDDLADIIDDLPQAAIRELLQSMDHQHRSMLEAVRSYDEDVAGGLMDTDIIYVRPDVSIDVVLRYLRMRATIPENTDNLFVTDRYGRYMGALAVADLLTQDPELSVREMMNTRIEGIHANLPSTEVAKLFERRDLVSAPVINDDNELVGRITIDDVVDVIRDEAEHSIRSMAGLDEEDDMFAPVLRSTKRRSLWLGINLLTAVMAATIVGLFQSTIGSLPVLAMAMPIVASMGGVGGNQTLTIIVRGYALDQISRSNVDFLLRKELAIGALNGLIWGTVVGLAATYIPFTGLENSGFELGLVIGTALVFNMIFAALFGLIIPVILRRFGIDPALAGNVILTTITDMVGFFVLLYLGSQILL